MLYNQSGSDEPEFMQELKELPDINSFSKEMVDLCKRHKIDLIVFSCAFWVNQKQAHILSGSGSMRKESMHPKASATLKWISDRLGIALAEFAERPNRKPKALRKKRNK